MILSEKVQSALNDTLVYHKHQKRKGTEIPYAAHPISLAMLLIENKLNEDLVVAALLHDTIEDTSMSPEYLRTVYGDKVYELVMAVTEMDQTEPWEIRKQHTIDKFPKLNNKAKWLVLVDKLHNLYSMVNQYKEIKDELWQYFSRGYEKQRWYYQSLLDLFLKEKSFENHELLTEYQRNFMILFEG